MLSEGRTSDNYTLIHKHRDRGYECILRCVAQPIFVKRIQNRHFHCPFSDIIDTADITLSVGCIVIFILKLHD